MTTPTHHQEHHRHTITARTALSSDPARPISRAVRAFTARHGDPTRWDTATWRVWLDFGGAR